MLDESSLQTREVSLRDYVEVLRRRRVILLQTFAIVFAVGLLFTLLSKPVYRSTARIVVEGKSWAVTQYNANDPLSSLFSPPTGYDVSTQIEVLQGERVLQEAMKEGNIPPRAVQVDVKQVGQTDVIELQAESPAPEYAQRLAQTLPTTYLRYITGNRKAELSSALAFARDRLREENEKLTDAEIALQRFRERTRVANLENERNERISQLIAAEGDLRRVDVAVAGGEARVKELVAARQAQPEFIETPTTTTNTQREGVKEKIAALKTQRAALIVLFKPGHPRVQEVDAQIAEQERQLAAMPRMVTTISRTLNPLRREMDARIAEARAELLSSRAELAQIRARVSSLSAQLAKFGSLERQEAQLKRTLAQHKETVTMLARSAQDLSLRVRAQHDPVMVMSPAGAAVQVSPRTPHNLLYSALLGILLGFCLALLQEFLDDRINTPEEARQIMDAPVMGFIPRIEKEGLLLNGPHDSSLLESYRVLRTNIHFSSVDTPIRSLLITSAVPGEGKTITAANLGIAMALDGKNVILVDTNLRQPMLHRMFGLDPAPGVTDVLVGDTTLEEALRETSVPRLRLLPAGPVPPNPAELLNTQAMLHLHDTLKERADIVIFDSPSGLATADTHVLASYLDGVLFVMRPGAAKKKAVQRVGEMMQQARARVLGIVFNKMDSGSRQDEYTFGYSRPLSSHLRPSVEAIVRSRAPRARTDLPATMEETVAQNRREEENREENA